MEAAQASIGLSISRSLGQYVQGGVCFN
ncbi:hypothetical protein Patl1_07510 [Pistacia atlantica]|uniref:Uncharacterized protein n=1 Tax=Pistacia atlantica TaxID=434234 RepID=A0ACC1AIR0_9ROSI|nr:hypothetical protein Patl1_07510 [Pistacia atlantica]